MATRHLNKTLKQQIKNNIEAHVRKKMNESIPGKELASMKKSILDFLKKEVLKQFTKEELSILKKYGYTRTVYPFHIAQEDNNGRLGKPWIIQNGPAYLLLEFTPALETPGTSAFYNGRLIDMLEYNEKMKALTIQAIKTFNHIECEIKETVNAFMEIVDTFRTVNPLVKNHPDLGKFIPKPTEKTEHEVSKKAQAIIKNFNAA